MATKKNQSGYLLPENPDPDNNLCICVPVPNDERHIQAFLGQIVELGYWYTWERDTARTGRIAAEKWREIYECISKEINCAMANGNCGCSTPDYIYRHNPETDRIERSSDGGATWENDPSDPRYNSPVFAPQEGETEDDIKCLSATNATVFFKDELMGQASEWTTLTTVIAGILSVLIGLLTGGLGAALVIELASTFINVGIGAAIAAFTPEVYDRFKCNLYCNALDDGSWDEAALVAIKNQIDIDETGVANTILKGWIDQCGTVGLTNSGRVHLENDADCSSCDCPEGCAAKYVRGTDAEDDTHGTIISLTENTLRVQLNDWSPTAYNIIHAPTLGDCCYLNTITVVSGSVDGTFFIPCGTPYSPGAWTIGGTNQCVQLLQIQGSANAVVDLLFSDCP